MCKEYKNRHEKPLVNQPVMYDAEHETLLKELSDLINEETEKLLKECE